jgi:hypothetical protein
VKQPIKVFVFLAILSFTLNSCKKEAIKIDSHFIGIWAGNASGYTYHLSIDNRSNGYWEKDNGGNIQYARGVARSKNNELFIGIRELDILQYPYQDSIGTWAMNLDGTIYQKQ